MKHWSMLRSFATPRWMGCLSITGLPPSSTVVPVPIYTPGWRETKWSKFPCLEWNNLLRALIHHHCAFQASDSFPRSAFLGSFLCQPEQLLHSCERKQDSKLIKEQQQQQYNLYQFHNLYHEIHTKIQLINWKKSTCFLLLCNSVQPEIGNKWPVI